MSGAHGAVQVALRGVSKRFPASAGGQAVQALAPIDLDIRQGEFFAVVGPSGCGKSTLLELIAGLLPATEGRIEFEGRPVESQVPDGIGVVFRRMPAFPGCPCATTLSSDCVRRNSAPTKRPDA
jgi:NitT/TauT family transport system ATP-binding protein